MIFTLDSFCSFKNVSATVKNKELDEIGMDDTVRLIKINIVGLITKKQSYFERIHVI